MTVDVSVTIGVPPAVVWHALADPAERAEWWDSVELDLVPGGKLEERWTDEHGDPVVTYGTIVEVSEGSSIRFTWADSGQAVPTEVRITLRAGGEQTVVRIREAGWEALSDGAELAADHRAGWRVHLTNLRRHLESAR